MMDHKKTMTGNCDTWKIKNKIAPCHLNISRLIIIYSRDGKEQKFNYLNLFDRQITAV